MRQRHLVSVGALAAVLALVSLAVGQNANTAKPPAAKSAATPKTGASPTLRV